MLELAILGLLKEHPMHGYQLSKELTDTLGGFWRVSYGSLYPTLRRLEKARAIEVDVPTSVAGGTAGRRKNVYRITDAGEQMFTDLLAEVGQESGEDNKFRVRMAFFRYLKPETRIRQLERRRSYLEERLNTIETQLSRTDHPIDAYSLSMMTHGQDSTRSDIAWLDDLIANERGKLASPPLSSPSNGSSNGSGNGSKNGGSTNATDTNSASAGNGSGAKTGTTTRKKRRTTPRRKEHTT